MFNYAAIDATPTVLQVKAIIDYMENDPDKRYNFKLMMTMKRVEPDRIRLDLNNAHMGRVYDVVFKEGKIESFKNTGSWIS